MSLARLCPPPVAIPPRAVDLPAPVSLGDVARTLDGLDPRQRRVVTHGEGPLLVLAGPGSGKTEVITRRVAWLIATKRARPSEILALTFTDKAAREMQARVDVLVPYGQADTTVQTFHAFGDALVREFALELGLPGEPRLVREGEAAVFLGGHLFELGLDRYRPLGDPTRFLRALVALFGRAKEEDIDAASYRAWADGLAVRAVGAEDQGLAEEAARQREIAAAYGTATRLMAEAGLIDHGDQVALALRLLRDHADVGRRVRARYRYVLVDEAQDTNRAQLELLHLVAGEPGNVTVVGDDDQAIYGFRGAAVGELLRFDERQRGTSRVVLRRNHRSRAAIAQAAYRLIRHNDPERLEVRAGLDKRPVVVRRRAKRIPIVVHAHPTPDGEADAVATALAGRIAGGRRPGAMAVLGRRHADLERVARSLRMLGVAHVLPTDRGQRRRGAVTELCSLLRLLADPGADPDFYAVATGEPYGLGGVALSDLVGAARRRSRPLWAFARELREQPRLIRLPDPFRATLARLLRDLDAAADDAHARPAGQVLYDHLLRSGRLARLAAPTTTADEEALRAVSALFDRIRAASRLVPDDRVPFVAPHLDALSDAGEAPADPAAGADAEDGVRLMTAHAAKGLEFAVVHVIGLSEGDFPGRRRRAALLLPDELLAERTGLPPEPPEAEERRLFYVAMTRARDELVLSYALADAAGRARRPSRFLAEALDDPHVLAVATAAASIAALRPDDDPRSVSPAPRTSVRRGPLSLSFSQVDEYRTCPKRYELRHVLGVPTPPHHALGYGVALHQAVAAYHAREMAGEVMSEDELLGAFDRAWSSEGFLSRAHEDARYAAGREALRRFRAARLDGGAAAPAAVERPFTFLLGEDRVRGRYDRIDETPDGAVITDYKSGDVREQRRADEKARESLQLRIYALAHEAETGTLPAAVELHFLDTGLVGRAPLDERRLARARDDLAAAADGIREARFEARPDAVGCGYCPYRRICPASAA